MKKFGLVLLSTMMIWSLSACGTESEETTTTEEITETTTEDLDLGEVTEVSEDFVSGDTVLTYFRNADGEGNECEIDIEYYLSQMISVSEDGQLLGIDINNFEIIQPSNSVITLDGAYLYGAEGELIRLTDGEIHISDGQVSRNASLNYDVRLNFSTETIGVLPEPNASELTFTEQNDIFTTYMRNQGISSDDLRGTISFKIEIRVLNDSGEEETCFKDFELVFIPGNFLMEPYIETGNIFTYENTGEFLQ